MSKIKKRKRGRPKKGEIVVPETIHHQKQIKFIGLLKEGYSPQKAKELAGYSETTSLRRTLENVNYDEIMAQAKGRTAVLQLHAIKTAHDCLDSDDTTRIGQGLKAAVGFGKVHLEDKTPASIVFHFQTIDKQLVLNKDKNVDKPQLSTKTDDVE